MECEARRRGIYRRLDRPITAIATHEAPRSFNARAIALQVEPVVKTSSTTSTRALSK